MGKTFDRSYNIRLPFLNGFYDIGIFFNKKSTFLLFSVDSNIKSDETHGIKINMFKNLESSKFCETFLQLHNYRKNTLDILNQYKSIKPEYYQEVSFVMNETITLSKIEIEEGRFLFDSLNIYGFTLNSYTNEFIFILTERQNIVKKLGRKIVRTSGIQIATTPALHILNHFHIDSKAGKAGLEEQVPTEKIIKLEDIDEE
jgi:hypothetical protein